MGKRTFKTRDVALTLDDSLSKADIARALLDEGLTAAVISKLVPMAYSQVHSIAAKRKPLVDAHGPTTKAEQDRWAKAGKAARERPGLSDVCRPDIDYHTRPHSAGCLKGIKADNSKRRKEVAHAAVGMPSRSQVHRLGIGKLRTPGMPTDVDAGPCANCEHDLSIRGTPTGYVLIHTNVSAEEYLATIQFCQAVPQLLLHKR